jgi:hypothetical protein
MGRTAGNSGGMAYRVRTVSGVSPWRQLSRLESSLWTDGRRLFPDFKKQERALFVGPGLLFLLLGAAGTNVPYV